MQFFTKKGLALRNSKGFTLIELLVVIAIIGLLSSIVLVSMGGARKKARDAKRESDIRQISTAMEMCLDDTSCGTTGGYVAIAGGTSPTPARITTTLIGTYLNPLPQDPGGGSGTPCTSTSTEPAVGAYCGFTSAAGASDYCIFATLSTGQVIAASEKGVQFMAGIPGSVSACP